MKMLKNIKGLSLYFLILLCSFYSCKQKSEAQTNYYFHPDKGKIENSGTYVESPFRSLSQLDSIELKPGDSIFLAANTYFNEPLQFINQTGSKNKPIVVSVYPKGENQKTFIETKGFNEAILIKNSSFIEISNLNISAKAKDTELHEGVKMRCGVKVEITEKGNFQHIFLSNLHIYDVFHENEGFTRPKGEVKTANGTQAYGWGIRFINNTNGAKLSNIKVENSKIENVSHTGIKLTSRQKSSDYGITDFQIINNQVLKVGGPGIQMSGVKDGHILENKVNHSGSADDSRKWGRGSGLWTWGSENVLIEHNKFTNANGPGDSAGAHIDFNCKNIVLQYNYSANNAGGFCEILGNNYNCAYRYNISVNDGFRIKGEDNAFQEGKTLWLSGYAGKKRLGPFNSYIYNNTIFVGKDIIPKIAIHRKAKGVLIANNIFHFENDAEIVKGDQYNPETEGDWQVENVIFTNNLYLSASTWPTQMPIQDQSPFYGNAGFTDTQDLLRKFTPTQTQLIKNRGVVIPKIPNDTIGLIYGLELQKDILGNPIESKPSIGAIQIN